MWSKVWFDRWINHETGQTIFSEGIFSFLFQSFFSLFCDMKLRVKISSLFCICLHFTKICYPSCFTIIILALKIKKLNSCENILLQLDFWVVNFHILFRTLADIDGDGQLKAEEFILAMHLTDMAKAGQPLPLTLPPELVPPSFRWMPLKVERVVLITLQTWLLLWDFL